MEDDEIIPEEVQKFPENIAMEDVEITRIVYDPCEELRAPVRPRVPSDPVIGVTPAVDDERKKRKRTHPLTLDMEAVAPINDDQGLDIVALPSPILPILVQPPSFVSVAYVIDKCKQRVISGKADASISCPRLKLQPLVPTVAHKPKKMIRRQGQGLVVDMETQILLNILKQGLEHYDDILRCPHVVMDLAPIFQIRGINFMAPGRKVGKVMADYFKEAAQVRPSVGLGGGGQSGAGEGEDGTNWHQ